MDDQNRGEKPEARIRRKRLQPENPGPLTLAGFLKVSLGRMEHVCSRKDQSSTAHHSLSRSLGETEPVCRAGEQMINAAIP